MEEYLRTHCFGAATSIFRDNTRLWFRFSDRKTKLEHKTNTLNKPYKSNPFQGRE